MADDGQEKTEEPTPKKKEQAREDGKLITSKEMFVFTSIAAATLGILIATQLLPGLTGKWARGFVIEHPSKLDDLMLERLGSAILWVLMSGIIVGIPLMGVTVLTQAGMGGLNFAPKALGFKFNKLDPLKGMKRMVSLKSLVELAKAVLKVVFLIGSAIFVVIPSLPAIDRMASMSPGDGAALLGTTTLQVLSAMTIALGVIGALDLVWQIHTMLKDLRMSKQEIKEEFKESEGSPELKGQIRRKQNEAAMRAKQRAALPNVDQATAIVTNPTHFAVALRYVPEEQSAPVILAMGRGGMAQQVIERGKKAKVTIVRVPPLARALYYTGGIGSEISVQLYSAVATLLAHVWRIEHGQPTDLPDIDLPPELQLDENGRPQSRK
ncbi:EscU/YscU/HrcU family type III secretion system export apparatus switch protein [Pseudoprimorskyibacter insulae]|uniref:Flagellar biosynthetic protein FlhB n=1 Tax=Pseudoprimorskyibacter insulae TaxID=1695997 RepID=A0A2R8AVP3_9RHOB|nr:EscU/YscU/HrcU family type III secretion system export apparatus switch protein [Pseudoprimorskyibacter insulae]SPF80093.1 Flagellar biosynthetic protein FlhB [Pseudoprimorskyibacter insulae]